MAQVVFTLFLTCALNFQVYCPANSSTTQQVPSGYYPTGTSGQRSGIALCAAGSYCSGGAVYPCASGRVGTTQGASNSLCDAPCPAGKAPCAKDSIGCCSASIPALSGLGCVLFWVCHNEWAGSYCSGGTVTPLPCGNVTVYCPLGSAAPQTVSPGYYTNGSSPASKTGQLLCPAGAYCSGGLLTYCTAGSFRDQPGK